MSSLIDELPTSSQYTCVSLFTNTRLILPNFLLMSSSKWFINDIIIVYRSISDESVSIILEMNNIEELSICKTGRNMKINKKNADYKFQYFYSTK